MTRVTGACIKLCKGLARIGCCVNAEVAQVRHELSVPAVSLMTMSWAAFAVATAASVRMEQSSFPTRMQQVLWGAATLASLLPAVWVSPPAGLVSLLRACGHRRCRLVCKGPHGQREAAFQCHGCICTC